MDSTAHDRAKESNSALSLAVEEVRCPASQPWTSWSTAAAQGLAKRRTLLKCHIWKVSDVVHDISHGEVFS